MKDNRYIKKQAKSALSHHSPKPYYVTAAVMLISACISLITSVLIPQGTLAIEEYALAPVFIPQGALAIEQYALAPKAFLGAAAVRYSINIATSWIMAVLMYGFAVYCLKLYRNRSPEFSDLGSGFPRIWKLILLQIAEGAISGIVALPFLAVLLLNLDAAMSANVAILLAVSSCLGVLFGIYFILGLVPAHYVFYDNPEMSVLAVLGESFRLMKGGRWRFLGLILSFIGYFALAGILLLLLFVILADAPYFVKVLLSGAAALIYYPYLHTSVAGFYQARLDARAGLSQNNPPEDETI